MDSALNRFLSNLAFRAPRLPLKAGFHIAQCRLRVLRKRLPQPCPMHCQGLLNERVWADVDLLRVYFKLVGLLNYRSYTHRNPIYTA